MLEIFSNALRDQNYYICLYSNHIYIYNYLEIITFTNELIIIKLAQYNLIIKGSNMHIKKMENSELLVSGIIKEISYE